MPTFQVDNGRLSKLRAASQNDVIEEICFLSFWILSSYNKESKCLYKWYKEYRSMINQLFQNIFSVLSIMLWVVKSDILHTCTQGMGKDGINGLTGSSCAR